MFSLSSKGHVLSVNLLPLIAYISIVVVLILFLLVLSAFLGQKRKDHATHLVYESGVTSVGSAQLRISVPYYLTAILFIIFDLEAVFLFAWAISVRESGWLGYVEATIFIGILLAGLVYLWKVGALEWRTMRQRDDLTSMQGPGGVVNINRDGTIKGPESVTDDQHGHGHH